MATKEVGKKDMAASAATPDILSRRSSEVGMQHETADQLLSSMGYEPQLTRNRSTLQVAFMSFVLASIPYGLSTTMSYPIIGGGPAVIIWGWVAVSAIIVCTAASLGEITSVYPTAGGVYHQTFMLSPDSYRRVAAYICGWLYVVGNVTITLSVNFASATFLVACVNVFGTEDEPVLAGDAYQVFLIFLGVTLLCNLVCTFLNDWLPWIDTFAIFWTFAGVLALMVCVLAIAKEGRRDAAWVFSDFEPQGGWTPGWSFMVGLLHAAYGTSSTGMIISMCEEVRAPAIQVPRAMVMTIFINTVAGLMTMIPLVFVLPDVSSLTALAQPVPTIVKSAIGHEGGTFALLIPLIVLGIGCGIGCTTASSRAAWAFSRDGAMPGSKWWSQVNTRLSVPVNAMMLCMVVEIILGLIYFGSSAAFNAFSGVGVICLTTAYAAPIVVSMLGRRRTVKTGSFYLKGALGWFCNFVAIGWSLLAIPLFCMPSAVPVTDPSMMNFASVVFVAFSLISIVWYVAWGRKNYVGPPTDHPTSM